MVIHVSGFTGDTSNNNTYEISTVAIGKMVLIGNSVVDDAAGETVTIDTGKLIDLEFTAESLQQTQETTRSNLIRNDRQVPDIVRTNRGVSGSIDGEVKFGEYDDMICAALYDTGWSEEVSSTAATYAMVASGNKLTDSGSGLVSAGFVENQWVKISGFTLAANNGYFKLGTVAAGEMALLGRTVADEIAGDTVTIQMGPQVVNGVTQKTYTFEKCFTDLTTTYQLFNGCAIDGMTVNVSAGGIMTCSFPVMGKISSYESSSIFGDYKTSQTTESMNAIDDVDSLIENGTAMEIIAATFQVANNARSRTQVATLGPVSLGTGTCVVTGTVRMYFDSVTVMDKFLDSTDSSLALVCEDADGNGYVIDCPAVEYATGGTPTTGLDTDVIADLSWQAKMHATEGITIRVAKFAA